MNERINVVELPEFDPAAYLGSPETVAVYLSDVIAAGDSRLLAEALCDIARAHGMTEIAKHAGVSSDALDKALRVDSSPRFDIINRICTALGMRLVVVPMSTEA
jgi:probable addiction module antidote protein